MIAGGAFSLFAIAYFLATFTFKIVHMPNTITAVFMPRLLSFIVFGCSAYMFLRGLKSYRSCSQEIRQEYKQNQSKDREGQVRCILVVIDLVIATAAFKQLGFLLTMPWMMFILFLLLTKKEKRSIPLFVILSVAAPIIVFFVFCYGFSQLLPMGILRPYMMQFL